MVKLGYTVGLGPTVARRGGSNPSTATNRSLAQPGSATALGAVSRGFKSLNSDQESWLNGESSGLLNRRTKRYWEFESLTLRQFKVSEFNRKWFSYSFGPNELSRK